MKFAIACAMLLAGFSTFAAAADDRHAQPATFALATTPSAPNAEAPPATSRAAELNKPDAVPASSSSATPATATPDAFVPLPTAAAATDALPPMTLLTPTLITPALMTPALMTPTLVTPTLVTPIMIKPKLRAERHKLFDFKNTLALSAVAASLTADALSTQKGLAYPGFYEMNPIARPFVQTRAGAAAYSAASFGLIAGTMYIAHKTHHHKLERILPFVTAGWEGLLSARNYHVIAAHGR